MSLFLSVALIIASLLTAAQGAAQKLPEALVNANVGELRSEESTSYEPLPLKHPAHPVRRSQSAPTFSASGVYSIDLSSGQELYVKSESELRPIASITKLATALVIIRSHKLDEVVTIPQLPLYKPEETTLGLQPGQKFTIKSLLAATLIQSANDAADALAIIDSGSIESFSKKMNALPAEWGINEVQFTSASGLNDNNKASAKAIGKIAALIVQNKTASDLVKLSTATINDTSGKIYTLSSTNELLPSGSFTGIKTGYTPAAGQCFVGRTKIDGHEVITVVLGSQDRFGESAKLADWLKQNYTWIEI